ncbi:MAG: response regulator [Chthoniobacterales bacterium]
MSDPLRPNDRSLQFNHQRILAMDDESAIRGLTAQLLGTMNYEVTAVSDGSDAVCIYERAVRKGEHFHAVGFRGALCPSLLPGASWPTPCKNRSRPALCRSRRLR